MTKSFYIGTPDTLPREARATREIKEWEEVSRPRRGRRAYPFALVVRYGTRAGAFYALRGKFRRLGNALLARDRVARRGLTTIIVVAPGHTLLAKRES